jgi:hypothetical protein
MNQHLPSDLRSYLESTFTAKTDACVSFKLYDYLPHTICLMNVAMELKLKVALTFQLQRWIARRPQAKW